MNPIKQLMIQPILKRYNLINIYYLYIYNLLLVINYIYIFAMYYNVLYLNFYYRNN